MAGISAVNYIQPDWYRVEITGMPPKIEAFSEPSSLKIDNTAAWRGMGIYLTVSSFLERMAEKGREKVSEAIATIVRDGDELARIEKNGWETIINQAVANSWDSYDFEFLHNAPALPRITYTPGSVRFKVKPCEVRMVPQNQVNLLA
ncbi:MAG: hypothetical protein HPY50_12445 [Firmicutes bacterium]|nr:hypothetical protein [Bacillota bacterium]